MSSFSIPVEKVETSPVARFRGLPERRVMERKSRGWVTPADREENAATVGTGLRTGKMI